MLWIVATLVLPAWLTFPLAALWDDLLALEMGVEDVFVAAVN